MTAALKKACFSPFPREKSLEIIDKVFRGLQLAHKNPGVFNGAWGGKGPLVESLDPSTNTAIAQTQTGTMAELHTTIAAMNEAKVLWRRVPAPKRGDIVRQMRETLATHRDVLGMLVSLETGKILAEGIGEIQEYIDVCDYAVGLSRTLEGKVLPSERPGHFMMETWNPLGIVGVISAFNFPAAVYGWNSAISLVCGNPVLWKGAPTTNLTSIAITKLLATVLERNNLPGSICSLVTGGPEIGHAIAESPDISLVSFTGSTTVGRQVGQVVQRRFGQSLLELGGNNAIVVLDDADMELALRSVLFAAVGTAGQRCTTCRRLLLHEHIYDRFMAKLVAAYQQVKIGSPFEEGVLCGPLHRKDSVGLYTKTIEAAQAEGGHVLVGNQIIHEAAGNYVAPTIIAVSKDSLVAAEEAFVPILYAIKVAVRSSCTLTALLEPRRGHPRQQQCPTGPQQQPLYHRHQKRLYVDGTRRL